MKTITGNTYPVKDRLKALGGKWNPTAKGWDVPDDKESEARAIVASAPVPTPKASHARNHNGRRPGVCWSCGTRCKFPYTECWDCREERLMGY